MVREADWLRVGLAISGETYGPTSSLFQISSAKLRAHAMTFANLVKSQEALARYGDVS